MTLEEAHKLTLVILKQVMEEKLNEHNVQLAQVRLHSPSSLSLRAFPQRKPHCVLLTFLDMVWMWVRISR